MHAFFLACALLGGGVLVAQLLLGLVGVHHGLPHDLHAGDVHAGHDGAHGGAAQGLQLLSVRALAAGLAFFGVGGLAGADSRWGILAALPLAILLGAAAMVGVALATRGLLRLEEDRTASVYDAVGQTGTVYLAIPPGERSLGKVHVTLRDRLVELQATSQQGAIATGTSVLVVDVAGPDTVVVVPNPIPNEVSHVVR
jgi:membrane protein implicated in regulation of membrane protease activity